MRDIYIFVLQDGEAHTRPYFVRVPDCACPLNSSFLTPVTWDLHIKFCSEMIKRNL